MQPVVSVSVAFRESLSLVVDGRGAATSQQVADVVLAFVVVCALLVRDLEGVAAVRKEWINVARTLEVGTIRRAFTVILPAAAPTILTGMRISIGIAWLVIVAAEMLVGGTGIGYFVWNEWNNLSITNVIIAILMIGIVGMLLGGAVEGGASLLGPASARSGARCTACEPRPNIWSRLPRGRRSPRRRGAALFCWPWI